MHHFLNRNLSARRRLCALRTLSLTLAASLVYAPFLSAQLPAASSDQIELRIVSGAGAEFQVGSEQKQRLVMQVVNQDERPLVGVAVTFQLPDYGPSGLFGNGQRSLVAFTNEEGEVSIDGVKWNNTAGQVSIRVTAAKGMAHAGTLFPVRLTAGSGKLPAAASTQLPKDPAARRGADGNTSPPAGSDVQPGTLHAASASAAPQEAGDRPAVTITGASPGHNGLSGKKWLVIAVVAAGAAAGVTMALLKKSGSSTSSAAGSNPLSIGSPTVSVGQP
jgi:hypothetical protein